MRTFRKLSDSSPVDLIPYVKDILSTRDDIKVYIGTDSQNTDKLTHYAAVIVLHYGNNGGHVLNTKESFPKIRDRFTRLWNEVEMSLELAVYLKDNGIMPSYVDLDLNPDPEYGSNSVLRSAFGYVESLGFKARCKPEAISASYVADKICK
jgi:predicted RNase H-related nuclease YkuK (DUF458 family)